VFIRVHWWFLDEFVTVLGRWAERICPTLEHAPSARQEEIYFWILVNYQSGGVRMTVEFSGQILGQALVKEDAHQADWRDISRMAADCSR
jgi:hypothetical protein